MSASRSVARALFLALWSGAAVFVLSWLASRGVDSASARLAPGGILYITRAEAVLYGIAALPLSLLAAYRLSASRLPSHFLVASSLLVVGAVAWFWMASSPRALLGAAFFQYSAHDSRLLARAGFALGTLLPWCVLGWSLARGVAGRAHVGLEVAGAQGSKLQAAFFAVFLVAAPYFHEVTSFSGLSNQATNALPDLFYDEALRSARRLQLLGGDLPVAGMPLDRFLSSMEESKVAYKAQMLDPETRGQVVKRFPVANPLLTLGNYDEAGAEIEGVLKKDPDNPRALLDRARLSQLRNEAFEHTRDLYAEAARAARAGPERVTKPVLVRILTLYGDSLYRTQDLEQAEAVYLEALEVEESAQLHLNVAHVYQREGRARLASRHLRRAMALQPEARANAMGALPGLLQGSFDCAPALAGW